MQVTRLGRDISITDRRTALGTALSGGLLAVLGIAILIAGAVAAGGPAVQPIIFGFVAAAAGALLLRFGIRSWRRLANANPSAEEPHAGTVG